MDIRPENVKEFEIHQISHSIWDIVFMESDYIGHDKDKLEVEDQGQCGDYEGGE